MDKSKEKQEESADQWNGTELGKMSISSTYHEYLHRNNKRKRTRNWLCATILLAVLVLVLLLLVIAAFVTKGFGLWRTSICHTKECVHAASRILHHMDNSVDRCEDFYKYACGTYAKVHDISPGSNSRNPFSDLSTQQAIKLNKLLEKENDSDPEYVTQAKNFYKSCMNQTKIDMLGLEPLEQYIRNLGGWTVLDRNYNIRGFRFEGYWMKLGFDSSNSGYINNIFGVSTSVDPDNSAQYIIYTGQTGLGMGSGTRDNYIRGRTDPLLIAYEKMINNIAVALGANANYARGEISKIIDFEIELAKLTLPPAETRESAYNSRVVTLGEMNQRYKGIDWKWIITKTFQKVGERVSATDRIHVLHEPYTRKIGAFIKKTSPKTLAGYMMWRNIRRTLSLLDKKTREIYLEYNRVRNGITSERPRNRMCTSDTKGLFIMVTTKIFADVYFTEGTAGMEDMMERVKKSFVRRLHEADWLDQESRDNAIQKSEGMIAKLAYPKFINDEEALKRYVNDVNYDTMDPQAYFDNSVNACRKLTLRSLRKLRKTVNRYEWQMAPVSVNAFYNPAQNSIIFPLGILHPPFYDNGGLQALNYGAIGEVIGHEITHGYDDSGRLYDKFGNKKEWMSQDSVDNFKQKAQCVIDFYSNITVEQIGVQVNGVLTQGENIADLGGLAQAFEAYQSWVEENGQEQKLPGLDLTPDQLFFISYAQLSCSIERDKQLFLSVKSDTHTPWRERILAALRNTKEFSDVFQCPVGTGMNPVHRCRVW